MCLYAYVQTRLTLDLQDVQLTTLLRLEAARQNKGLRDIVVEALRSYLSDRRENQAVLKLSEKAFEEWDNPLDAAYDKFSR